MAQDASADTGASPTPSLLESLRRADEARESFPGEHWLVLAAGAWLFVRGGHGLLGRLTGIALGSALVARALTGRDGLLTRLDASASRLGSEAEVPGRSTRVVDGHVVASTAEAGNLPLDGGATPPWPEDRDAEGGTARDTLARERDPLVP